MALIGRLSWSKVIPYMAGQFLGGFLACPIIYAIYLSAVQAAVSGKMTGALEKRFLESLVAASR